MSPGSQNISEPLPDAERSRLLEVAQDPLYQQLLRERARYSWILTSIMLVIFFGYILLIAFAPELLARPIGNGTTTIGIPLGIGVILCGIVLTGVYVRHANTRFDPLIAAVVEKARD
jgi:uncharacterized membrane protein (DUF485 family)